MRIAPPPASIYASTLTRRQVRWRRRRRFLPRRARLLFAYAALVPLAVAAAERVFG
jgi:hypothetical protein